MQMDKEFQKRSLPKNILLDAKLTKQAKLTGRRVAVLERNLNTLNFVFCTRRT